MAKKSRRPRTKEIVAEVERFFGRRVLQMAAPGGKGRDSYRVHLADRSLIVTYRDGGARLQREARILELLSPVCDNVPEFLGYENHFLYQGDVGERRLSREVYDAPDARRLDLAAAAVGALFRIQSAARGVRGLDDLPHLGATEEWVSALVDSVDELAELMENSTPPLDRPALCEKLAQPSAQFVRWDCRPGNAAMDATDKVSWFDFEYSGRRHGAEDFAFLIGDEIWPVGPDAMFDIVGEGLDASSGHTRDDYLDFLGIYATFHALQRLLLVVSETRRRGWSTQDRAIRYDKVGTHPLMGVNVADAAAYCADRHPLTRPLRPMFEGMSAIFAGLMPTEATQNPAPRSSHAEARVAGDVTV